MPDVTDFPPEEGKIYQFAFYDEDSGKIILACDYSPLGMDRVAPEQFVPREEWPKQGVKRLKVLTLTKTEFDKIEGNLTEYKVGKTKKLIKKRKL